LSVDASGSISNIVRPFSCRVAIPAWLALFRSLNARWMKVGVWMPVV